MQTKILSDDLPIEGEMVKPRLLNQTHPAESRVLDGLWRVKSLDFAKGTATLENQGWNNLAKGLLVAVPLSMYDWTQ